MMKLFIERIELASGIKLCIIDNFDPYFIHNLNDKKVICDVFKNNSNGYTICVRIDTELFTKFKNVNEYHLIKDNF